MKRYLLITAVALLALSAGALASERNVVVNGERLPYIMLMQLDLMAGEPIPNGRYWLDMRTGEWGYEGGPAEGIIGQPAAGTVNSQNLFAQRAAAFCAAYGC